MHPTRRRFLALMSPIAVLSLIGCTEDKKTDKPDPTKDPPPTRQGPPGNPADKKG
jgi:hypothetical protein